MKSLHRFILSALCLLAPSAFASTHPIPSHFDAISLNGRMNVVIQPAQYKDDGDSVQYPHQLLSAKVYGHTLSLRLRSSKIQSTPKVTIHLHALNQLIVNGHASVTGSGVYSKGLELDIRNAALVLFSGPIRVNKINHLGSGCIQLHRITSDQLSITSSGGLIQLTGTAKQADIKLSGYARLDTRYLRVRQMMVQAKGHAVARILPTYSLQAFATQNGQIYFYKTPQYLSRYSRESGNILPLGRRS